MNTFAMSLVIGLVILLIVVFGIWIRQSWEDLKKARHQYKLRDLAYEAVAGSEFDSQIVLNVTEIGSLGNNGYESTSFIAHFDGHPYYDWPDCMTSIAFDKNWKIVSVSFFRNGRKVITD
jgi:hypothetical protein